MKTDPARGWTEDFDVLQNAAPAHDPLPPVERELQWGLVLPSGEIVWDDDTWNGREIKTVEQRMALILSLTKTASQVGWSAQEFLSSYSWVSRTKVISVHYEDIQLVSMEEHRTMFNEVTVVDPEILTPQ